MSSPAGRAGRPSTATVFVFSENTKGVPTMGGSKRRSPGRELFMLPAGGRGRWITLALWVIAMAVAFPLASTVDSVQSDKVTDRLPADAESTRAIEVAERVPGEEADQVLVVYHRDGGLAEQDFLAAQRHHDTLAARYQSEAPPVPSEDGTTLMYPVSRQRGQGEEATETATTEFVEQVRTVVSDHPPGLTAQVTGPSAVGADIEAVFEGIDTTLMLVTVAVVALLLILTYRSPFLWLVPLVSVGVAAFVSMAAVYVVASAFDLTVSTQSSSIMIVMVFGAGTDYALLLVARYREELRRHAALVRPAGRP